MTLRSRKGFTLVELLIALVMLLMVSAAFFSALTGVQRTTRTQTEMAAMRGTIRGGLQIVATDLQELYADQAPPGTSDIISMSATAITYKATRGTGALCEQPTSDTEVKILKSLWKGLHDPGFDDRDRGLFVFRDLDPTQSVDDVWGEATINGTVVDGVCGTEPAWVVPVTWVVGSKAGVGAGAPVRTYERMELGLVTLDGRSWLGIRSDPTEPTLLPLAGPLAANGVAFRYLHSDGSVTVAASAVKMIELRLTGETDRVVNTALSSEVLRVSDSLTLRVELRNSR
jgi:prepilin-type N-terminal cleavage/methylation domain-containing protein